MSYYDEHRKHLAAERQAEHKLSAQEREAIAALHSLSKKWPKSLWLFSASGSLLVMKKKKGVRATTRHGAMDSEAAVATIDIENDGGDF